MPTSTTSTTSRSASLSHTHRAAARETTVYRMMFSGSTKPAPPGFRVVDYTVHARRRRRSPSRPRVPMRLCPQITRDLATPFISKDGRYVVAHDDSRPGVPASLKIFEITATDPAAQTTTLRGARRLRLRRRQGRLQLRRPAGRVPHQQARLPDAVRERRPERAGDHRRGRRRSGARRRRRDHRRRPACRGSPPRRPKASATTSRRSCPTARCSTSRTWCRKQSAEPKRFALTVVDPAADRRLTDVFTSPARREAADAIGELWRQSCAPSLTPFRPQEAAWAYLEPDAGAVHAAGAGAVAAGHRRPQGRVAGGVHGEVVACRARTDAVSLSASRSAGARSTRVVGSVARPQACWPSISSEERHRASPSADCG